MKYIIIFFVFLTSFSVFSQTNSQKDSIEYVKIQQDSLCNLLVKHNPPDIKLKKRNFIYTSEDVFPVYNTDNDYAIVQFGKRKGRQKIFLYIKLSSYNACIKQDDVVEIVFSDETKIQLNNKFEINCNGNIVTELKKNELEKLINNKAISFMIYTFQKDYEFHLTEEDSDNLFQNLICLSDYKF